MIGRHVRRRAGARGGLFDGGGEVPSRADCPRQRTSRAGAAARALVPGRASDESQAGRMRERNFGASRAQVVSSPNGHRGNVALVGLRALRRFSPAAGKRARPAPRPRDAKPGARGRLGSRQIGSRPLQQVRRDQPSAARRPPPVPLEVKIIDRPLHTSASRSSTPDCAPCSLLAGRMCRARRPVQVLGSRALLQYLMLYRQQDLAQRTGRWIPFFGLVRSLPRPQQTEADFAVRVQVRIETIRVLPS